MSVAPVGCCSLDHPLAGVSARQKRRRKAASAERKKQEEAIKAAEPDTGSARGEEDERLRLNGYGRAFS